MQMSIEEYREHLYQNILQKRKENRRAEKERLGAGELLHCKALHCLAQKGHPEMNCKLAKSG